MAVILETTITRYIGLSTDTKPTGVQPGSTYFAYDTDVLYKTYDGTNWVVYQNLTTLTQAQILSDATPFPGVDIPLIKAKTDNLPASPAAAPTFTEYDYLPDLQDSGNLAATPATITATDEATGLLYTISMTLPAPGAGTPWFGLVKRIAEKLSWTLSAISTGGITVYLTCYVDADVTAGNLLYSDSRTVIANQIQSNLLYAAGTAVQQTLFNLIKNGGAHTFYFHVWKSAAGVGATTLSLCESWEGVGDNTVYAAGAWQAGTVLLYSSLSSSIAAFAEISFCTSSQSMSGTGERYFSYTGITDGVKKSVSGCSSAALSSSEENVSAVGIMANPAFGFLAPSIGDIAVVKSIKMLVYTKQ